MLEIAVEIDGKEKTIKLTKITEVLDSAHAILHFKIH